jgi:hypothetical protein
MKHFTALGLLAVCVLAPACSKAVSVRGPQPAVRAGETQKSVWVCHGGRTRKWQKVSVNAAGAHRKHGDRVSDTPKPAGQRCS